MPFENYLNLWLFLYRKTQHNYHKLYKTYSFILLPHNNYNLNIIVIFNIPTLPPYHFVSYILYFLSLDTPKINVFPLQPDTLSNSHHKTLTLNIIIYILHNPSKMFLHLMGVYIHTRILLYYIFVLRKVYAI